MGAAATAGDRGALSTVARRPSRPPRPEPVVDLMTALQQSVDEARTARHPTKADRKGK
ncbi:hypothetical protein HEP81_08218 (plasmid) [Streptomyces griseofuscus]|uniref:Uncharacterized protein n=1 Tax=Streptomyces griseofuscus TaxID=146922 RepID=A0A7H1QDR4_9ACTN|nr:hypothetical protein HEP81_08218 [Streptomyces griseofuscus]